MGELINWLKVLAHYKVFRKGKIINNINTKIVDTMKIITTKIRRGKVILLVSVLLSGFLVKSSQNQSFESYKQEIPNTNLFFEMVPIPAGEFLMGTSADEYGHEEDESPQRKVSIDAFWMGAHEVTWDIFELFWIRIMKKPSVPMLLLNR